jgi:hypothetical protein
MQKHKHENLKQKQKQVFGIGGWLVVLFCDRILAPSSGKFFVKL